MSGCFGRASAIGHAGEILQGALRLHHRIEPFLVTLPAPHFFSEATVRVSSASGVNPPWKEKALRAARLAAASWGLSNMPLDLAVDSRIPVARGCGSSTADCVAAVRAVAAMMQRCPDAETIAAIVQQAEGASDSTMFGPAPVAFLPCSGKVLRRLPGEWPAMQITVVDMGGPDVDTLQYPRPGYTPSELEEFASLLDQLEQALAAGDAAAIAVIASRSASIHQAHRPHPNWEPLWDAAMSAGAFGVARAHSGAVAAILSGFPLHLPHWIEHGSIRILKRYTSALTASPGC